MVWPVTFFAVAFIAGVFGYAGIAAASAGIAQILFLLFAGLGIMSLLVQLTGRDEEQGERSRNDPSRWS